MFLSWWLDRVVPNVVSGVLIAVITAVVVRRDVARRLGELFHSHRRRDHVQKFRFYREHPSNPFRLGRHQVHDVLDHLPERELGNILDLLQPIRTVSHAEACPVFDQDHCDPAVIASLGGDPTKTALGNCTMNAAFGTLMTAPFHKPEWAFTEDDCVRGYHVETTLDDSQVPGEWPPQDTGSSGPWSMLALEQLGYVKSFRHTRDVHTALVALNDGPVSIGIPWLKSMFEVDAEGFIVVDPESDVAGGHQVCLVGNDAAGQYVVVRNSWGAGWGEEGHAKLRWSDLRVLFGQGGDAVQPVVG